MAKYEEHLRKQRERNHRYRQQVQQARAADPEYAAMMAERKAEYERTRTAKRKAEHDALVERPRPTPKPPGSWQNSGRPSFRNTSRQIRISIQRLSLPQR